MDYSGSLWITMDQHDGLQWITNDYRNLQQTIKTLVMIIKDCAELLRLVKDYW